MKLISLENSILKCDVNFNGIVLFPMFKLLPHSKKFSHAYYL